MSAARVFQFTVVAAFVALTALTASASAVEKKGSFDRVLDVAGAIELEVVSGSGSITIRVGASDEVRVHGEIRSRDDGKVRRLEENPPIEQDGNVIRIGFLEDRDLRRGVSISYELDVPTETRLVSTTGSGSQSIGDIQGPLVAKTGSGSLEIGAIRSEVEASSGSGGISIDRVEGSLSAHAGSGSIRARAVAGSITANSGSGSIQIDQTGPGDAEVHTGSGDIRLTGIHSALEVRTGSGDLDVVGAIGGEWTLHASSGDVTLTLPAEAAFDLDAETSSGDIDTDHPVEIRGRVHRRSLQGAVRGGGPSLAIHTSSGDIQIR